MALDLELIGIRMIGDDPLGRVEWTPRSGFTVLGGVNGAGKTTMLEALAEVLTGDLHDVEQCELVFRVVTSAAGTFSIPMWWASVGMGLASLAGQADSPDDFMHIFARRLRGSEDAVWNRLFSEILDQRTVSLRVVGGDKMPPNRHQAIWCLSGRPTGSTPLLSSILSDMAIGKYDNDNPIHNGLEGAWNWEQESRTPENVKWMVGADLPIAFAPTQMRHNVGATRRRSPFNVEWLSPSQNLEQATAASFNRYIRGGLYPEQADAEFGTAERLLELARLWARQVSASANTTWHELRPDQALHLECQVTDRAGELLAGRMFAWIVHSPEGVTHRVAQLSAGQIRWAGLAVEWAISDDTCWDYAVRAFPEIPLPLFSGLANDVVHKPAEDAAPPFPTVWLLDEPELGLHRAAEASVGNNLRALAANPKRRLSVIAATHSPNLMASADHVLRVRPGRDGLTAAEIPYLPAQVEELGLSYSDLMGWYRAFVFVEGPHDLACLQGFLGPELEQRRIKVLFLGGARQMAGVLESQLFLESTDAAVICVLDGMSPDEGRTIWNEAQRVAAEDGHAATAAYLKQATEHYGHAEGKGLRDFIRTATSRPERSRFAIFGLPKPDVLLYLAPSYLSAAMPTAWEDVAESTEAGTGFDLETWKPNKQQLKKVYGFDPEDDLSPAVAKTLRHFGRHTDFDKLLNAMDEHIASLGP